MRNLSTKTSLIELLYKGMIGVRVMNNCRRLNITTVEDVLNIVSRYGSIERKFGPRKEMTMQLQMVVASYNSQKF